MKRDGFYEMRNPTYKQGLIDLISYIDRVKPTKYSTMIEIGSYIGESTTIFADHFNYVISVDPFVNNYDPNDLACNFADFDLVYQKFVVNTLPYKNITHLKRTSDDARIWCAKLIDKVDFVYIDGLHTREQVKKDIDNYLPLILKGGFIGGHDYHENNWSGVVEAVVEKMGIPDQTFIDTSWIKRI